ncbi:MAG: class I SAM-dependent methyltransferase, partial [Xanthomonadaceae bacterium]|nr:class I SAM-dependent methyltransferase [Xanthomonadaceae bacterium]
MPNLHTTATAESPSRLASIDRWCRQRACARMSGLEHGRIDIADADGRYQLGRGDGPRAEIRVHSTAFWRLLASGGSVGAGEAYVDGLWDSPDLVAVIRVLAANRDTLQRMEHGSARFYGWLLRALHRLNRNTLAGSRRNISAHYDLGNEFFEGWLDRRMQYSSGLFLRAGESLDQAQENKLVRIAERLQLDQSDHLLEIGTGWGGLAIFMAQRTGCRVTTTTISAEQYRYALDRVARAGLQSRITVLKQDYRELRGEYDKLVSVEMIEAVGADFLETYLACIGQLLKP